MLMYGCSMTEPGKGIYLRSQDSLSLIGKNTSLM